MKVSVNWLQEYFDENLPPAEKLAEALTFHSFEVEGVEEKNGDYILDVDVLPNRASDCLSHAGIALEISAILEKPLKVFPEPVSSVDDSIKQVVVKNETDLCSRYLSVRVDNIKIEDSPDWLKTGLENLEQRSINNIVDATNFCLLVFGGPLHAFDADKVVGNISVRLAKDGEQMTTLDGKDLTLDSSMLVIADDEGVLALAGIKGGKKAEVTRETKNLILESANFNGLSVRQTAQKVGIRTDASKRFENGISPVVAEKAMRELVGMILKFNPEAKHSNITDIYPNPVEKTKIILPISLVTVKLGVEIKSEEMSHLLSKIKIENEIEGENIIAIIPYERLDLQISEDLVEEIGRLYGYDKIDSQDLTIVDKKEDAEDFRQAGIVREKLLGLGFSEIYGYTFSKDGEVELLNPLAKDKPFLRTNLTDGLKSAIEFNLKNILFDTQSVKIFEIGTVFTGGQELKRVAVGAGFNKPKLNKSAEIITGAIEKLGVLKTDKFENEIMTIIEFPLSEIGVGDFDLSPFINPDASYESVSLFPRIVRDIALFVPEGTDPADVSEIIKDNAGELCVRGPVLFDEFSKDGRTSLAFRLIFQAYDRTLSDEEVNKIMDGITTKLEENKNFEVRK